jgi:hypothetical protein
MKEIEEGRADVVQAFHGSLVAFTAKPCPEQGSKRRKRAAQAILAQRTRWMRGGRSSGEVARETQTLL